MQIAETTTTTKKRKHYRFLDYSTSRDETYLALAREGASEMGFPFPDEDQKSLLSRAEDFLTFEMKRSEGGCHIATESVDSRFERFELLSRDDFVKWAISLRSQERDRDGRELERKGLGNLISFAEDARIMRILLENEYLFAKFDDCTVVDLVNTMNYYKMAYAEKNANSDDTFKRIISNLCIDLIRDVGNDVRLFYILPLSLKRAAMVIHPVLLDVIKTTSNTFLTGFKGCLAQTIISRGMKFNRLPSYVPARISKHYGRKERYRTYAEANVFSKYWSVFIWLSKLLDDNSSINRRFLPKPDFSKKSPSNTLDLTGDGVVPSIAADQTTGSRRRENPNPIAISNERERSIAEDPCAHYRNVFKYMEGLNCSHQSVFDIVRSWFHGTKRTNDKNPDGIADVPAEIETREDVDDPPSSSSSRKRKRKTSSDVNEGETLRPQKRSRTKGDGSFETADEGIKVLFSLMYCEAPHYITFELLDYLISIFFPNHSGDAYDSAPPERREKIDKRACYLNQNYPKAAAVIKLLKSTEGLLKLRVPGGLKIRQLDRTSYMVLKRSTEERITRKIRGEYKKSRSEDVENECPPSSSSHEDDQKFVYPYGGTMIPYYKNITEGTRTRNAEYKIFNLFSFSDSFATYVQTEDSRSSYRVNGTRCEKDKAALDKRLEDMYFCIFGNAKKNKTFSNGGVMDGCEQTKYPFGARNLCEENRRAATSYASFRDWLIQTYKEIFETFDGADNIDDRIVMPSPNDPSTFISVAAYLKGCKTNRFAKPAEGDVVTMSGKTMVSLLYNLCDNSVGILSPKEIDMILKGIRLDPEISERIVPRRNPTNKNVSPSGDGAHSMEIESNHSFNVIMERYRILSELCIRRENEEREQQNGREPAHAEISKGTLLKNGISRISFSSPRGLSYGGSYYAKRRFRFPDGRGKEEERSQLEFSMSSDCGFSPHVYVWLAAIEMTFLEMRGPMHVKRDDGTRETSFSPSMASNMSAQILPNVLKTGNNSLYDMYNSFLINPQDLTEMNPIDVQEQEREKGRDINLAVLPINTADAVNIVKEKNPTKTRDCILKRKSVRKNTVAVDASKITWDDEAFMVIKMTSAFVKSVLPYHGRGSSMNAEKTDAYHEKLLEMYIHHSGKRSE